MELSKRLYHVAGMVSKGNRVADIGTDHAYVPIWLLQEGIIPHAIAMDVKKGPLDRALQHIHEYHMDSYIETRLSDGLQGLRENEADTVVIAGMGGPLMLRIMEEGHEILTTMKEIILQPQSELALFRRSIWNNGYSILCEDMVLEDEKFYPMMKVRWSPENIGNKESMREIDYQYGKYLLRDKHPVLLQFLTKEQETNNSILQQLQQCTGLSEKRKLREEEILKKNQLITEALYEMS